jgi:hypothetical protein
MLRHELPPTVPSSGLLANHEREGIRVPKPHVAQLLIIIGVINEILHADKALTKSSAIQRAYFGTSTRQTQIRRQPDNGDEKSI